MEILLNRESYSTSSVAGTPAPHGYSIREQRIGDHNYNYPNMLTLISLSFDKDFQMSMRMNIGEAHISTIKKDQEDLFDAIKKNPSDPLFSMAGPGHVAFPGACFFTVVIDMPGWNFLYSDRYDDYDQIVFVDQKSYLADVIVDKKLVKGGQEITTKYARNFSFFDATPTDVHGLSAFRCINYCKKNARGDDLEKGEVRLYGFNMYITVPLVREDANAPRTVIIIDPTGDNQGPPVKPPLMGSAS